MSSSPRGVFLVCAMVNQTLHLGLTCLVIELRILKNGDHDSYLGNHDPIGHMSFGQHSHICGFAKSIIYLISHRYPGATLVFGMDGFPAYTWQLEVLCFGASADFCGGCRMAWVSPCSWADYVTPPGPKGRAEGTCGLEASGFLFAILGFHVFEPATSWWLRSSIRFNLAF